MTSRTSHSSTASTTTASASGCESGPLAGTSARGRRLARRSGRCLPGTPRADPWSRARPVRRAWGRRHPSAHRPATSRVGRAGGAGTQAPGNPRLPDAWRSGQRTGLRPSGRRPRAETLGRRARTAASRPTSRVGGADAIFLPATRHGCSNRATVTPWRGSAAARAARSRASTPFPAPWLRTRVAVAARRSGARSSRPSPYGVDDRPGAGHAPAHCRASSAGMGSTSSGPLLRTLLTSVETGKASSRPGAAGTSSESRSSRVGDGRVEPRRPPVALDHQRHPVVDVADRVLGLGGQHRAGPAEPVGVVLGPVGVAPDLVQPGHRQHPAVLAGGCRRAASAVGRTCPSPRWGTTRSTRRPGAGSDAMRTPACTPASRPPSPSAR